MCSVGPSHSGAFCLAKRATSPSNKRSESSFIEPGLRLSLISDPCLTAILRWLPELLYGTCSDRPSISASEEPKSPGGPTLGECPFATRSSEVLASTLDRSLPSREEEGEVTYHNLFGHFVLGWLPWQTWQMRTQAQGTCLQHSSLL